ncbi:MAG: right-handed parallel beta-helix repeat-containing protein, partial [Planctomycetota bacterium]
NSSPDGARSWAGAIYFGENCQVDMSDTTISFSVTTTNTRIDFTDPNAPGYDPNHHEPGDGGSEGTDGAPGAPGEPGSSSDPSSVSTFGGGNYYEPDIKVKMTNSEISFNASERHDGGGEFYSEGATATFINSDILGNMARYGAGQFYEPGGTIEVKESEYSGNAATRDGGGIFIMSDSALDIDDSRLSNNVALGYGGGVYGGGVSIDPNEDDDIDEFAWHNNSTIKVEDTEFYRNLGGFGGGMYWHGEDTEAQISYCKFDDNTADAGGGLFFSRGAPRIIGSTFVNNDADDEIVIDPNAFGTLPVFGTIFGDVWYGGGGGIFCWSSDARIEDCIISYNSASGSGGGVYLGGDPSAPLLKNCLLRNNTASIGGGGIVANWFVEPTIANCTIENNQAIDTRDAGRGKGGGISCTNESKTILIDSILWHNRGVIGNQIAIGSDNEPVYLERPAELTVSYSDIQGGRAADAIHVEPGRTLNWLEGNIDADPLFVQRYFLSQIEAGQDEDSPCVDTGSDTAVNLGMDNYTTRTDFVADAGIVDMGYHSIVRGREQELILVVVGPGTVHVDPDTIEPGKTVYDTENQTITYTYKSYRGDVVTFTAAPGDDYRVKSWTGTNNDPAWNSNTNTLTIDGSEMVRVEFEQDIRRNLMVPSEYETIEEAILAADEYGTSVIVDRGTHYIANPDGINFQGKKVILMSVDPDDPDVVANTIIDCQATVANPKRAFHFNSGEDENT